MMVNAVHIEGKWNDRQCLQGMNSDTSEYILGRALSWEN